MRITRELAFFRSPITFEKNIYYKMISASHISLIRNGLLAILIFPYPFASGDGPPLAQIQTESNIAHGLPISWNQQEVVLLERDGRIRSFEPAEIKKHSILKESFHPDTAMHLRGALQEEFGRTYAVDGSGDFVIVAAPESVRRWAQLFADLQRLFVHYFSIRGFSPNRPDFPLVGIVFHDQAAFFRHAAMEDIKLSPRTAGFYSVLTNRLYLYEPNGSAAQQREAIATIRHEATHQLAFNCGIHQRLSSPPLWALEGLASIFEAPGLSDPRSGSGESGLLNPSRLYTWKLLASKPEKLTTIWDELIRDDKTFENDPDAAYSVAWGMSLYLSERESTKYTKYLRRIDELPLGQTYSSTIRVFDVRKTFPISSALMVQSAIRYIDQLSSQ